VNTIQVILGVLTGLVFAWAGARIFFRADEQARALAAGWRVFGIFAPKRMRYAPAESRRFEARLSGVVIAAVGVWFAFYIVSHA
jgi:hypothetical protein